MRSATIFLKTNGIHGRLNLYVHKCKNVIITESFKGITIIRDRMLSLLNTFPVIFNSVLVEREYISEINFPILIYETIQIRYSDKSSMQHKKQRTETLYRILIVIRETTIRLFISLVTHLITLHNSKNFICQVKNLCYAF